MTKSLAVLLAVACLPACMDPVHDDAVKALGGEKGPRPGPLHRPGEPCLTCHGGEGPGESEFSVAGTVYLLQFQDVAAPGVTVQVEDINGVAGTVTTNEVGNFWINADAWQPKYPLQVTLLYGRLRNKMQAVVGRSGSCADCHKRDTTGMGSGTGAGPMSPGKVYVASKMETITKATAPQ